LFILFALLLAGSLLALPVTILFGAEGAQYATFISYPLMFILPMLYASVKSRNASMNRSGLLLDSCHFSPVGGLLCVVFAMLATLALGLAAEPVTALLPPMPDRLEDLFKSLTSDGNLLLNFLMVSLFAPFFEEWLCRGMVLRGLLGNKVKPGWAIVISAAFFAIIHLNPWQAVPAFLLGCLFGFVYYKTGSLKLTMLMHFTNNTFALVMSNIDSLREAESFRDVMPEQLYWILIAAAVLLLVLIVRQFARIPLGRPEGNIDRVKPLFEE
jgi:CAAX amino terminal protease family.